MEAEQCFKWFKDNGDRFLITRLFGVEQSIEVEFLYQVFKTRFLEEQKMTTEEFEEWKDKMVRK